MRLASYSRLRFGKDIDELELPDIEKLVDNRVEESVNLEYKEPTRNFNEDCNGLAKAISGLLNTGGGVLVYGVAEEKEEKHCFPTGIEWVSESKERLENTLSSLVQPWSEQIRIKRIDNKQNKKEGIFVVNVPKSDNPPHMSKDYRYYQRRNFQTVPMSHENVSRAFQSSWFTKGKLRAKIVEPLYSEIMTNCGNLGKYEVILDDAYSKIISTNRYLYDQINPSIRQKIDEFYSIAMGKLKTMLVWVGQRIATRIMNEELCRERFVSATERNMIYKDMAIVHLKVLVEAKDPSGEKCRIDDQIEMALILKKPVIEFLKSRHPDYEVISYTPFIQLGGTTTELPDFVFNQVWDRCEKKVAKDPRCIDFWVEHPKTLALGKYVLREMLQGSL